MGLPAKSNIENYSKNHKLSHEKSHVFLQVLVSLKIKNFVYLTSGTRSFKIHLSRLLSARRETRNTFPRQLKGHFGSQITWIQGLRFSEVLATWTDFPGVNGMCPVLVQLNTCSSSARGQLQRPLSPSCISTSMTTFPPHNQGCICWKIETSNQKPERTRKSVSWSMRDVSLEERIE